MLYVREMERIDGATGRSTIFRAARMAASHECRTLLRVIAERRWQHQAEETDNGPRLRIDLACGSFWLVYL